MGGLTRSPIWQRWLEQECDGGGKSTLGVEDPASMFDSDTGLVKADQVYTKDDVNKVIQWFEAQLGAVTDIFDPVATYIASHMESHNNEDIVKAVCSAFDVDILRNSKQLLIDNDIPVPAANRNEPNANTKTAQDILKGLRTLDQTGKLKDYRFCVMANQLNLMPKFTPGEMCNSVDVLRRLALLEKQMEQQVVSQVELAGQVAQNTIRVDINKNDIANTKRSGGKSGGTSQAAQSVWNIANTKTQSLQPTRQPWVPGSSVLNDSGEKSKTPKRPRSDDDPDITSMMDDSSGPTYVANNQSVRTSDGFQIPKDQIKQQMRRQRPRGTAGKKDQEGGLSGGPEVVDIVISRVGLKHTKEDLVQYIKEESNDSIIVPDDKVEKLTTDPSARTNAWKISVTKEHTDLILSGDLFHKNIEVRLYRPKRRDPGDKLGQKLR